jgi:hypothetical protein
VEIFEVTQLLRQIATVYPTTFKIKPGLESMADTWFLYLEDEDSVKIAENLEVHVKNKHFPPTIADLVRPSTGRAIPSYEDTMLMLEHHKERVPSTEEGKQRGIQKLAEALGRA